MSTHPQRNSPALRATAPRRTVRPRWAQGLLALVLLTNLAGCIPPPPPPPAPPAPLPPPGPMGPRHLLPHP